jgi:hypothetical protein
MKILVRHYPYMRPVLKIYYNGIARFKIVNNCLNTNIYAYKETSGGKSFNFYVNVHVFNISVN